ncbi:MAG TPA: ATP synthase F1 subunit delta [Patescibacteria group bacterium]
MKVTAQQYAQALLELTDGKSEQEISAVVEKFALQLKKDGQLKNIERIMQKFSALFNKQNGIVEAEVVSREKLGAEMIKELEKFIREKYSADVVAIENVVDADIKGGIIIKVGDEILDGSVATQLKKLKKTLSN